MSKPLRDRRVVLKSIAGALAGGLFGATTHAFGQQSTELPAPVREVIGKSRFVESGISITLPELAETGQSVPVRVEVTSAMTGMDRVKRIVLIAESNPRPRAAEFTLNELMPKAVMVTRVRLATSQDVYAVAEMADGNMRVSRTNVVVTQSACIDGT